MTALRSPCARTGVPPAQDAPARVRGGAGLAPLVAVLLIGAVAFFVWKGRTDETSLVPVSLEDRYVNDPRIVPLVDDCGFPAAFERDLTDIPAVLVGKLDAGSQPEPWRRAQRDLAAIGEPAKEELMRLFEERSKDRMRARVANNVLAVCATSDDDFGVEIALRALESPRESIRGDALLVLRKHPAPEHFDKIKVAFPSFSLPVNVRYAAEAMYRSDPVRFVEEYANWVRAADVVDGMINSQLIDDVSPLLAESDDPKVAERLLEIEANTPEFQIRHRMFALAPAARLGDADARQRLNDTLASDGQRKRLMAAEALGKAGLADDAYVLAATAETDSEAVRAHQIVFSDEYEPVRTEERLREVISWARIALGHEVREVQELALHFLLEHGDAEAIATLNQKLSASVRDRELATRAMRGTLDDWPEAADQVRNNLIALWQKEKEGGNVRAVFESLAIALGAVPGRATGEFLLARADEIGENVVRGERGYRWVTGQILNAGKEASAVLRERLDVETDPFKRLDLISQIWQEFDEVSYETLAGVIEDESRSPYERLYAADRALRMGEHDRLAPMLKRLYRGSHDPVLRPGLHCLLWIWYGPPVV